MAKIDYFDQGKVVATLTVSKAELEVLKQSWR